MTTPPTTIRRRLEGTVVSARQTKTRVVLVMRTVMHPKYGKRYERSHRYPAHDEQGVYQVGDKVVLEECRPLSRTKRWRILRKA